MGRMAKDRKIHFSGHMSAWRWHSLITPKTQIRLQHLRFMPQIARILKASAHDLYRAVTCLADANTSNDPDTSYNRVLRILVKHSTTLYHWGRSLPMNPYSLNWISWSYLNSDKQILLTPIVGYSGLLLHVMKAPDDKRFSFGLLPPAHEAYLQQCQLKARRIAKHIQLMRQFQPVYLDRRATVVAPHIIAPAIWSHLAMSKRFRCIALLPAPLPKMPRILFAHPDVYSLVERLFGFGREPDDDEMPWGDVYMYLRRGEYGAEFCLTMKDYRLMPAAWDQVSRAFEDIHVDGYIIEPLTWDEGYGQGVIMRLPWAKDNP